MAAEGGENGGSGTAAAKEGRIRIYIGGLGGSVTSDDLKKTFTSPQLGKVDSVELVRTKGRSFAYLDFVPVSDKGLAKLFSMYNGCVWKGGRLRLEKAKEHYLLRLKREWAEDVELSNDSQNHTVDAVEKPRASEKPSKVRNSEMQLRIFFPKFRKVKALPFKGTGKHKYSFQHIEVPPLPIHFCDCEEHCFPFEAGKREPSINHEMGSGGMNDEELSMMNSIMSKIFQKESCPKTASRTDEFATEACNSTSLNDDFQFDHALADQESDEDNLIINVVAGPKSNSKSWGPKATAANQDSQASNARPIQRMPRSQGKRLSSNKRKAPCDEEANTKDLSIIVEKKSKTHNSSDDLEIIPDTQPTVRGSGILQSSYNPVRSQRSAFKNLVSDRDNATFRISDISTDIGPKAEGPSKSDNSNAQSIVEEEKTEPFQPIEENRSTETICNVPNAGMNKSVKSTSWLQKSSWMQLVGNSTESSFSISQILPGQHVEKQELQPLTNASNPINGDNHNFMKTDGSISTGDVSEPQVKENKVFPGLDGVNQSNPAKKLQAGRAGNEASTLSTSKRHPLQPKHTSGGGSGTSGTFTFMRSAASMKEWMKTRAALSGSLKKKRYEKQAAK